MNKKKIIIKWEEDEWLAFREGIENLKDGSCIGVGSFPVMALQNLIIAENNVASQQTKML